MSDNQRCAAADCLISPRPHNSPADLPSPTAAEHDPDWIGLVKASEACRIIDHVVIRNAGSFDAIRRLAHESRLRAVPWGSLTLRPFVPRACLPPIVAFRAKEVRFRACITPRPGTHLEARVPRVRSREWCLMHPGSTTATILPGAHMHP